MIFFNALLFFFKETFIGIRRSGLMTFIAVITISITLIILGVFMLISTFGVDAGVMVGLTWRLLKRRQSCGFQSV